MRSGDQGRPSILLAARRMSEDGIGRVLVASLHQGIAENLPARLGFYENWLSEAKLRDGAIGLAPLYAVLSFLRQEGPVYDTITARAGQYAAEWTVDSMPALRRSVIRRAPLWLRGRLLMRRRQSRSCGAAITAAARSRRFARGRPELMCVPRCSVSSASRSIIRCAPTMRRSARVCSRSSTSRPRCRSSPAAERENGPAF